MNLSDFNYHLPKELIAQRPCSPRHASRLLVLDKKTGKVEHRRFRDVADYFRKGDLLILNNTKVIPARILGKRETGGKVEILLLREVSSGEWEALLRNAGRIRQGEEILLDKELSAEVTEKMERGKTRLKFTGEINLWKKLGSMPLPPYIRREADSEDVRTYQTVYAEKDGAIAAPTAGLHFSGAVFDRLKEKGVEKDYLTIHVGWGSFQSVKTANIEGHRMEKEYYEVSESLCRKIQETKSSGRRVIAVGTSTTRALETIAGNGSFTASSGFTDLFIYPPFQFKVIDGLVTNFHLPGTTLIMLVSAFCGKEKVLNAYREAIKEKYRFYSYGDAMLVL